MATIKKRTWTTPKGELKEAWRVRYVDNKGAARTKQFLRRSEANAWKIKAEWEVSQGVHTADSASITVGEAADLWVARARNLGRERSTVKQYEEWVALHIKPLIGSDRLSKLTTPAVEAFKDALLETRSAAMAGKVVRGLSSILTEAQRRGLVAQNVVRGVKVVRSSRDKKKIIIPPPAHLRAMIEAVKGQGNEKPGLYPLILTAISTGLRSSELRGLRWIDVDLKAATITVEQRADQWGVIGAPKSEAGCRVVPIGPSLVAELRAWKLRSPNSSIGLVFPNTDGGVRLHSNLLNREYWPLQVKAGLTKLTGKKDKDGNPILRAKYDFHALRHAAASAWISQKIDLKRLTVWMGHSSVQITIDTYGHLMTDATGDAALAAAAEAALMA